MNLHEVYADLMGEMNKLESQCHSRHTMAAGIESVKEQYCLFFLHISLQRYSKNEDLHFVLNHALTSAMTSISTNAPLGNVLTATAERAGYGSVKNSA